MDFKKKYYELKKYSNPKIVLKKLNNYYGKYANLFLSTKKNKKYMIQNPYNNKWIHFGQMGYEDFTRHKDDKRRLLFQIRNSKWAIAPQYTARNLAYYLLW